jgi:hypothetical protein
MCLGGALAADQSSCAPIGSYLYEPSYVMFGPPCGHARPYLPQPGDVMLATDPNVFWTITHDMALAFEPHGSGIIITRPDGCLAVLEAGPNDCLWIKALDMLPHLKEYADKGHIWIRKRKTPLTPDQSAALTDFGMRQVGKRFALGRLGVQLTPFRDRGPFRTAFMGGPHGDRKSYYCSELVLESCVAAGLVDCVTTRPSATYPHELFFDQSYNRYIREHLPLVNDWEPPARWVPCPLEATFGPVGH